MVKAYVDRHNHYNDIRLNSAIGYITPKDMLAGPQPEMQADRDGKLEAAGTAEESPAADCVTDETDYFRLADDTSTTRLKTTSILAGKDSRWNFKKPEIISSTP